MRPDLMRLLVDTRCKELVSEVDANGGVATYSTRERLGLNAPLEDAGKRGAGGVVGLNDSLDGKEL
jgi:cyanide hydratase